MIHAFSDSGFPALEPKYAGGAPPTFDERVRRRIVDLALGRPKDYGFPFTRWSLRKLTHAILELKIVHAISPETVRRILLEAGVSHQRTKTWKESHDPLVEVKRRRILRLYRHPPPDGRVASLDELGPLNIQPVPGSCYARKRHPQRIPQMYHRTHGVRHMPAILDLKENKIDYRIRKRKTRVELLEFLRIYRALVPEGEKIYLIMDNFSPHLHRSIRTWARENGVVLVFTPTNASWLNRIECHFAPLREFVLRNSDYHSHAELTKPIIQYVRLTTNHEAISCIRKRVNVA
ncbi:MAG: IS630 family transposase [Planctomycetota bacterium]